MYYWGDIAEILLALAMLLTWRPQAHRARRPVVHAGLSDPGSPATSR